MGRVGSLLLLLSLVPLSRCAPQDQVLLSVSKAGRGTVTSEPAGIDCGARCSASFPRGATVTLTATPGPDAAFVKWICVHGGRAPCTLTLEEKRTYFATAQFGPRCDSDRWCRENPVLGRSASFAGVWGTSERDVWIVGDFIAHWDGAGWGMVQDRAGAPSLLAVWGSDPQSYWAISGKGDILRWDGTSWADVPDHPTGIFADLWGSGPRDIWIVGLQGLVLHWDGARWTRVPVPPILQLLRVRGTGPSDAWAVGAGGLAIHWDGTSWTATQTPTQITLSALWGGRPDDYWASGEEILNPDIPLLHWDGTSWRAVSRDRALPINAIWGSGPSDVWAVTTMAQHWNGSTWSSREIDLKNPFLGLYDIWGGSSGDIWAVGDEVLHRRVP